MAYVPGLTAAEAKDKPLSYFIAAQNNVIFNPNNDAQIKMTIPFWSQKAKHRMNEPTGLFIIKIFQPMVVTQESQTDIPWTLLVHTRMLNFFYAKEPGGVTADTTHANGIALGNVTGPQGLYKEEATVLPVVAQTNVVNNLESTALIPKAVALDMFNQSSISATAITNAKNADGESFKQAKLNWSKILNDVFAYYDYIKTNVAYTALAKGQYQHVSNTECYFCNDYSGLELVGGNYANCAFDYAVIGTGLIGIFADVSVVVDHNKKLAYVHTTSMTAPVDDAKVTIESICSYGTTVTTEQIDEIKSELEAVMDDDNVSHAILNSTLPAEQFAAQIAAFSDNPSVSTVPTSMVAQSSTFYGAASDARAKEMVAPADGGLGIEVGDGLLGPIFDLVSNLPIIGDVVAPFKNILSMALPFLAAPQAAQTIVFDVAPDGNDVKYVYNNEKTSMTASQYAEHRKAMIKKYSAQNAQAMAMQTMILDNKLRKSQEFADANAEAWSFKALANPPGVQFKNTDFKNVHVYKNEALKMRQTIVSNGGYIKDLTREGIESNPGPEMGFATMKFGVIFPDTTFEPVEVPALHFQKYNFPSIKSGDWKFAMTSFQIIDPTGKAYPISVVKPHYTVFKVTPAAVHRCLACYIDDYNLIVGDHKHVSHTCGKEMMMTMYKEFEDVDCDRSVEMVTMCCVPSTSRHNIK